MTHFLHISSNNTIITETTFIKPKLKQGYKQHSFNVDGVLYLSKVDDDDPKSSMWIRRLKLLELANNTEQNTNPGSSPSPSPKFKPNKTINSKNWSNSTWNYYSLDIASDIYVVDTPDALKQLFVDYGKYDQYVENIQCERSDYRTYSQYIKAIEYNKSVYDNDVLKLTTKRNLIILDEFIAKLDILHRSILITGNLKAIHNFEKLIISRNIRNMPLVTIRKNKIVVPTRGITYEFLVDIIRTKQKWEHFVQDFSNLYDITLLRSLDHRKLMRDGYNGIYYSTNLVKFSNLATTDTTKLITTNKTGFSNLIEHVDIGELPDFLPFCNKFDYDRIKTEIEAYVQWLESDTLMLWNWPLNMKNIYISPQITTVATLL